MVGKKAARRGPGAALAVLLGALAAASAPAQAPPQDEARTCFVCHADAGAVSAAGRPIFVDPGLFDGSVHGRAGLGCVGCHADLAGVDDFPHAPDPAPVGCARCHPAYGPGALAGVHGVMSPRLAAKPVSCGDCHGAHDILPSSSPASRVHASNVPATCGRCHPGAGTNFARGRVHEPGGAPWRSPAGIVRSVYRLVIGIAAVLCCASIAVDIVRRREER